MRLMRYNGTSKVVTGKLGALGIKFAYTDPEVEEEFDIKDNSNPAKLFLPVYKDAKTKRVLSKVSISLSPLSHNKDAVIMCTYNGQSVVYPIVESEVVVPEFRIGKADLIEVVILY